MVPRILLYRQQLRGGGAAVCAAGIREEKWERWYWSRGACAAAKRFRATASHKSLPATLIAGRAVDEEMALRIKGISRTAPTA